MATIKSFYYPERGEKNLKTTFKLSRVFFSNGFMIVASFACNSKLKIKRGRKIVRPTPHIVRNAFYAQSSNMKCHLFTHSPISPYVCIKTAMHHNPLLIS